MMAKLFRVDAARRVSFLVAAEDESEAKEQARAWAHEALSDACVDVDRVDEVDELRSHEAREIPFGAERTAGEIVGRKQ